VSFDRDSGPDDGSPPPVDVVVPDDARALARDVLAYRREMRSRRRHERLLRLARGLGVTGHPTVFPLIATCVALALLAGTMLSVASIKSGTPPPSASPQPLVTTMPEGEVRLDDAQVVPTTWLNGSLLLLVAPECGCGTVLLELARQAKDAGARVYFVYNAQDASADWPEQAQMMTSQYGDGVARTVYDLSGAFFFAFATDQVTALLADRDGVVHVVAEFPAGLDLTPALRGLSGTH
jgi:hypothetical protein